MIIDYLNILMIMMNLDVVTRDQAIKRARFCRENYSDTRLCQHLEPSPLSVVMVVILLMMTTVIMIILMMTIAMVVMIMRCVGDDSAMMRGHI